MPGIKGAGGENDERAEGFLGVFQQSKDDLEEEAE